MAKIGFCKAKQREYEKLLMEAALLSPPISLEDDWSVPVVRALNIDGKVICKRLWLNEVEEMF